LTVLFTTVTSRGWNVVVFYFLESKGSLLANNLIRKKESAKREGIKDSRK